MDPTLLLNWIAAQLGLSPATVVLVVAVIVAISNLVGRLIPDDATGWQGVVRKVTKVLGLYLSNRVSAGITVNDVTKTVAGVEGASQEAVNAVVATGAVSPSEPFKPPFPGATNGATVKSHWLVTLVIFGLAVLMFGGLAGCTTLSDANLTNNICTHQLVVRLTANQAMQAAELIQDPAARAAAEDAAQTTLDLVNACPPIGTPAPVGSN